MSSSLVFVAASGGLAVLVASLARIWRGRFYARAVLVMLAVEAAIAGGMFAFDVRWPFFAYGQVATTLHFASLVWARPRGLWFRLLVSWPGLWFTGCVLLGLPWSICGWLGVEAPLAWLPFAVGTIGMIESFVMREKEVDIVVDRAPRPVERVAVEPTGAKVAGERGRPLRIVQITDPHLGPFMSVRRLRRICERAVARDPDLVLLTGDFLTMESQGDPNLLADALAPLRPLAGRTFACHGNHDHEAPQTVAEGLARAAVRLLVDEEACIETPAGPVQIVGVDFRFRGRRAHLERVCATFPRRDGHLRLLLLHDPGAFRLLPEGEGDLVLSGHTHGGQLGLVSLGLRWTIIRAFSSIPDHGFWARGRDRLYVHRGTGHYGFPLRVGVPPEHSMLRVHVLASSH